MGGINSLSGLNKVNVDFRPTVNLEEQNKVEIAKSDGTNVMVGNKIGFVGNYCVVDCPSYYKRDYLDKMFK